MTDSRVVVGVALASSERESWGQGWHGAVSPGFQASPVRDRRMNELDPWGSIKASPLSYGFLGHLCP